MKDHWSELVRRARQAPPREESIPFGFEQAVLRRLDRSPRESLLEAFVPYLRPAAGLAFTTAIACILLRGQPEPPLPDNLLVQTENLIQLAVLE